MRPGKWAQTTSEPREVAPCCPACGSPAPFPPGPPGAPPPTPQAVLDADRKARLAAWTGANAHRLDVTAAEVAEVAGVSVRRVQALFRAWWDCTPMQAMAAIRLHRVHLALTGQGPAPESMAKAAAMAGFSRVARFNAAYRQRYGRDPKIYPRAAGGA